MPPTPPPGAFQAPSPSLNQPVPTGTGAATGGPRPIVQQPRIWVQRTFPKSTGNPPTFDEEFLQARQFVTETARVKATASRTINLGNYESMRIEVGVEYPCYVEEVEDGDAVRRVSEMVSTFLHEEEQAIKTFLATGQAA